MKTQSDRAPGGPSIRPCRLTLAEQERLAYISGDIDTAKLLGELLDAQAGAVEQRQDDQIALVLTPRG